MVIAGVLVGVKFHLNNTNEIVTVYLQFFLQAVFAVIACTSVRLSDRPSHDGIIYSTLFAVDQYSSKKE